MSPTKTQIFPSHVTGIHETPQLTLGETAYLCGTSPETIRTMVDLGLISAVGGELDPTFAIQVIPRVRRILRLHHQVDIDLNSMEIVLDLLQRIEELESILARLTMTGRNSDT